MKQMHDLSVQTDFSFSVPSRFDSLVFGRLGSWFKQAAEYLAANGRELMLTTAATLGISALFLAASYLFFVQLAADGW